MLGRPKLGRASKYEEAYKCEAAQYVRHPQFVRQLRFWENFNLNVKLNEIKCESCTEIEYEIKCEIE